jgi:hypothetical protein
MRNQVDNQVNDQPSPPKKEKNSNSSVQENLQNEHVCRYPQQHPKQWEQPFLAPKDIMHENGEVQT